MLPKRTCAKIFQENIAKFALVCQEKIEENIQEKIEKHKKDATISRKRLKPKHHKKYAFNYELDSIKPRFFNLLISCISQAELQHTDVPLNAFETPSDEYAKDSTYSLRCLYEFALADSKLDINKTYSLTYAPFGWEKNRFRLFALPYSPSAKNAPSQISQKAQVLIPYIFLPLGDDIDSAKNSIEHISPPESNIDSPKNIFVAPFAKSPTQIAKNPTNIAHANAATNGISGVYIFYDWICLYDDGILIYDDVCTNLESLESSIMLMEKVHDIRVKALFYHPSCIGKSLNEYLNLTSAQSYINTQSSINAKSYPESNTKDSSLEQSILDSSSQASPKALPQILQDITFCKINKPIPALMRDYLANISNEYGEVIEGSAYAPIFNEYAKSAIHTKSFSTILKIACVCALILCAPLIELAYVWHLESKSALLFASNAAQTLELEKQKAKSQALPREISHITDSINSLYALHSSYTPRIKIISNITQIISQNAAWIMSLELEGALDSADVMVNLHIAAALEDSLERCIYALKNESAYNIISEEILDSADLYSANVRLKIRYV